MNVPPSDGYGARTPPKIWTFFINRCHKPDGPLLSRLLAPLVRRAISNRPFLLPVDIHVGGMKLRCRFIDNYSEKKFVFTPWRYDRKERALLSMALSKGGVFIDIGANVGLYTLTAAMAMAGKKGRIIAFEPNPETFARLTFNLCATLTGPEAQAPVVTALNIGVADKETTFRLAVDHSNLGASSISTRNRQKHQNDTAQKKSVEIACRPLLDVLREHAIDSIDALKIDIEGAEDLALGPFLEKAPASILPGLIFIESSQHLWNRDLIGMMQERGYKLLFQNRMNQVFSLH